MNYGRQSETDCYLDDLFGELADLLLLRNIFVQAL